MIRVANLPLHEATAPGNRPTHGIPGPWFYCWAGMRIWHTDTEAELLALAAAGDGDLGFTHDTKRLWFFDGDQWRKVRF